MARGNINPLDHSVMDSYSPTKVGYTTARAMYSVVQERKIEYVLTMIVNKPELPHFLFLCHKVDLFT